jgi:hypothetical protein
MAEMAFDRCGLKGQMMKSIKFERVERRESSEWLRLP